MTKLAMIRKEKKISQFELAKKCDVSIQLIQSYEQKRLPIEGCRLESLLKICYVLDVKIWDILEDDNLAEKLKLAVK